MIIRRETLNAVLPATASDDSRYFLQGAQFEPASNRVIATNGHILLMAPDREPFPDDDFPAVPGAAFHGDPAPIVVPADVIKTMIATMPKRSTLPILHACQLSQNGSENTATITASDLTAPRTATINREDRQFPAYDHVIPKLDRPSINVCLAVDVLEALCKSAKAVCGKGKPTITFNLSSKNTEVLDALGITIKGETVTVTGAAMPCRM